MDKMVEVKKVIQSQKTEIFCDLCGENLEKYHGNNEYNYGTSLSAYSDTGGDNFPSERFDLCYHCALEIIQELKERVLAKKVAERV